MPQETHEPLRTSEVDDRLYKAIAGILEESRAHYARIAEETERYTRIAEEANERYGHLEERMTALEQSFAAAVETFQARADGIHRDTSYVRVIATQAFAAAGKQLPPAPAPSRDAPRPMAIDRACAADPASGEQRIDLPEYGMTIYVMPGDDPARVWSAVLQSIHGRHSDGC